MNSGASRAAEMGGKVLAMFERFRDAFTQGDGSAAARCWDVPALVVSDAGSRAVSTLGEVADFFGSAAAQYTQRGVVSTRPEIQRTIWHTNRLASVEVRWPYLDATGTEVGESESSTYVVRLGDDGELRICVAVMMGAKEAG